MRTFHSVPGLIVTFNPPVGVLEQVEFDEKGEFTTDNELVIERFFHRFDSVPVNPDAPIPTSDAPKAAVFSCKKCDYVTEIKTDLLRHYRKEHPKEG